MTHGNRLNHWQWLAYGRGLVDMPARLMNCAGMKVSSAIQYTLRQIPPALDVALRRRSRRDGKSMNQTAIEVLQAGLAMSGDALVHRDLDFMVGSWEEDSAFDEAIQAQDRVDLKLWQ